MAITHSGLSVVLESLDVKHLWMHQPWNYAGVILNRFRNPRLSAAGLEGTAVRAMRSDAAHDLEVIARAETHPGRRTVPGGCHRPVLGPFRPKKNGT